MSHNAEFAKWENSTLLYDCDLVKSQNQKVLQRGTEPMKTSIYGSYTAWSYDQEKKRGQHLTFWFLKTGLTLAIGLIFVGYLEDLKKTVD